MATTELNRQAAGPDLALESNNDDVRSKFPKQSWERRLSAVEGFDPKQYARTIRDADGQESLYLDVQYRKMWFRLCNPTGKIVKKICTFDGNLAVVEARIYLDRNDAPENFVSNAIRNTAHAILKVPKLPQWAELWRMPVTACNSAWNMTRHRLIWDKLHLRR